MSDRKTRAAEEYLRWAMKQPIVKPFPVPPVSPYVEAFLAGWTACREAAAETLQGFEVQRAWIWTGQKQTWADRFKMIDLGKWARELGDEEAE